MEKLSPWEKLAKEIIWQQLGMIENKAVLDFGSGAGITANHYAENNTVTAIEPSAEMFKDRCFTDDYIQIIGSTNELKKLSDESFDLIICHNVLEYVGDRETVVNEFYRLLKPGGKMSVVKHNRNGRVMQMVVLLNNFAEANALLDGKNSSAKDFGVINYYSDGDISEWCSGFHLSQIYGLRTFFDLQQNQQIQTALNWQENMLNIEMRVCDVKEFIDIAFFHHLIFIKEPS